VCFVNLCYVGFKSSIELMFLLLNCLPTLNKYYYTILYYIYIHYVLLRLLMPYMVNIFLIIYYSIIAQNINVSHDSSMLG